MKNTSQIKNFKILSEAGVAAGVRRIEALTGDGVMAYYRNLEEEMNQGGSQTEDGSRPDPG